MRLTGYADFSWESSGYSGNLPPGWIPTVTVNPTVLPRSGTYATLGIGVVGEMTIPCTFLYRGTLTFEAAMLNLFKRLNPVDTSARQLRAVRNDGTPIAIPAVLRVASILDRNELNAVTVTFVAVQPYWEPLNVPAATTNVFDAAGLEQSVLLPVQGEFPTSPELRIMATAQRATPTSTVGWKYRRRITITNGATDPLQNYPFALDLGLTSGLVSASKALSSGNDLRVLYQGREIARSLVDWNSATFTAQAWIVIPYLAAKGAQITYDVIYGNAGAGAPPTLTAGIDLPAFDIATAGANRSSNLKWVYLVDRTVANAGLGGAYLSSGVATPTVKFSVPGAWQLNTSLVSNDDRRQEAYSSYVATGTKYQFRFEARRAKAGSVLVTENNGADGVSLRDPVGISSVRCDLRWKNLARGDTDTTPTGQVVILTRNAPGETYTVLYSNNAAVATDTTIAVATYTPPAPVKEVAFAVWPYPDASEKTLSITSRARFDRYINAAWYTTLEVNKPAGVLTQGWTPHILGSALKAWFAADAIGNVADGATVSQWNDLSNNNLHATQGTAGFRPIFRANRLNGLPGVEFDGTDDAMVTGLTASWLDETILAVIDDDTAAYRSILGSSATGGRQFRVSGARQLEYTKQTVAIIDTSTALIPLNVDTIVGGTLGTTTGDEQINGTVETFSHAQTLTGGLTSQIGSSVGTEFWDGDIHELIITTGLSAANRQLAEGYLAWKWGLVASLPSNHPYKTVAPGGSTPGIEGEVYEYATRLRYGGGGDTVGVPSYKTIRLGNTEGLSGVGTPRLLAPLNTQVVVSTERRALDRWDSGLTTKLETLPLPAVTALDVVEDGSGTRVEQHSADWMPLLPTPNPLTNPDFDVDISGWTLTNLSGLVTDVRFRTAGVFVGATPGGFAHAINASTLGGGLRIVTETANDRLPIGTRENVSVGAAFWGDTTTVRPRLTITFYTSALSPMSTVLAPDWTPPGNSTFRRRLLAAPVPAGAVFWSPGWDLWSSVANATGSVVADAFAVNDTEVALLDTNSSGLTFSAVWLDRYAYG